MADRAGPGGQDPAATVVTAVSSPPFFIGGVRIDPPTALAPMADLTDVVLRTMLKEERTERGEVALGLVVTEFLSSRALLAGDRRVRRLMATDPRERPLSVQIYGSDPEEMADAARVAADSGADILDINMGCPVSKITGHGSGAALLKDPPRARAMVAAVRGAVGLPVTVKMRAGWDAVTAEPVEFAKGLVDEGAAALAVHPRTRQEGYSGSARRDVIAAIKEAVAVPVMGNGDIRTPEDAYRMMAETGCDGVMVGRGALKNPRLFCEIAGDPPGRDRWGRRLDFAVRYGQGLVDILGPKLAFHRARKLVGLMFRGEPDAKPILRRLNDFHTVEDLVDFFQEAKEQQLQSPDGDSNP